MEKKSFGLRKWKVLLSVLHVIFLVITLAGISAMYLNGGYVKISDSLSYIPTGLLGSLLGTVIIRKISPLWLKRIFGAFMIYAGVRLLIK